MPTDKELLIKDLMHKCDCLYRENSRLKEMVSTQPLKAADKEVYEALLSDKDAIIAQKEAKINSLEQRVSYLERQLYGKKAEKFIKPDAQDRWLDFEGFDMLPQEAEAAEEAEKWLLYTTIPDLSFHARMRGSSILRENPFRRILSVRWSIYIPKGIIRKSGRSFPERK